MRALPLILIAVLTAAPYALAQSSQLVLAKGWLTKERLDDLLKPENLTHPRKVS